MAQQQDKERERPQAMPPNTSPDSTVGGDVPKDPDVYDPVGMAGKKAGIVNEIEKDQKTEQEEGKDAPAEKPRVGKPGI